MTQPRSLDLTLRVGSPAADARRGVVRAHPEVLLALGLREWDALEIVGARRTAAVVAATRPGAPSGVLVVDEVVAANCGLGDDAAVTVRPAAVAGATSVEVRGLPATGAHLPERLLRSALLGKVLTVGDSVTLLPRDLGPDFPTGETTRSLRDAMGMEWSTRLLTVTATRPDGVVSVQPTTAVVTTVAGADPGGERVGGTGTGGSGDVETVTTGTGQGPGTTGPLATDRAVTDRPATEPAAAGPGHGITEVRLTDLVGLREKAEVLRGWLSLSLDRPELLRTLGASAGLGVVVAGPPGVGKATLVRAVCAERRLEVVDGPSVGALEAGARIEAIRAATARVRGSGGVLLVTDVDALLPAEPEPVSTMVLDELRQVVAAPGVALVVTCVRPADADARLREPELCDRVLELPLPSAEDRAGLLGVLLRDVPTAELDLTEVAARTPGHVAGDLRALVREAALRAAARAADPPPAVPAGAPDAAEAPDSPVPAETPDSPAPAEAPDSPAPVERPDAAGSPGPRLEQTDLLGALEVIRPLSRTGTEELELGSVTLDDVGDMVEVRQTLTETVLWPLRHPEAFDRLGVQPTRGVLLYGPPGCGKTFVVRALAASGRLTVHMVKGAELMDKWVGSSEKAVRELFRRARDSAPSLVFLDEIDALAPRRGQSADSGVGDRVVAALLTELDGAEPLTGVVVLGATNRPELIDPALLRPGRLEKLVFVPPPDAAARAEILRAAARGVPLAADVDLDAVAAELDGYSAADCSALLRESALAAMRRDIDAAEVTGADVATARDTVGPSLDAAQVEDLRRYASRRDE